MNRVLVPATVLLSFVQAIRGEVNCHELCNLVRGELNAGIPCRQYRKTLPRPKVGNACRTGYMEAVTDACFATCTGEAATNVVSQACRQYRAEMPKPVMFNSCETGYNAGFDEAKAKVMAKLQEAEHTPRAARSEPKQEKVVNTPPASQEGETKTIKVEQPETVAPKATEKASTKLRGEVNKQEEAKPDPAAEEEQAPSAELSQEEDTAATEIKEQEVVAILPVNIEDHDVDLVIHRNEDPADAVKRFCAENMADSADACETQLLPHVLGKLEEKGI